MVTTPWIRLSENVLSQSITKFYIKNNLVPCGITHDALESWSARMASACNKLVRKFRRLFMENPKSSKLKPLTELKQRCLAAGIQMPEKLVDDDAAGTPPPRLPSHEDLEAIAPAQGGTDRLEALAKIISDKLAMKEKREIALKENALAKAAGSSEAHSLNVADCSSGVSLPAEKSDEKKGDAKPVPTPVVVTMAVQDYQALYLRIWKRSCHAQLLLPSMSQSPRRRRLRSHRASRKSEPKRNQPQRKQRKEKLSFSLAQRQKKLWLWWAWE